MNSVLKDFYAVEHSESDGPENFTARIRLNADHEIFEGHFPENPVTPGVCMMQMVKDLAEQCCGEKLFLKTASNVKFLVIINPNIHPEIRVQLALTHEEKSIKVKSTISFAETTAMKMSAHYLKIQS